MHGYILIRLSYRSLREYGMDRKLYLSLQIHNCWLGSSSLMSMLNVLGSIWIEMDGRMGMEWNGWDGTGRGGMKKRQCWNWYLYDYGY